MKQQQQQGRAAGEVIPKSCIPSYPRSSESRIIRTNIVARISKSSPSIDRRHRCSEYRRLDASVHCRLDLEPVADAVRTMLIFSAHRLATARQVAGQRSSTGSDSRHQSATSLQNLVNLRNKGSVGKITDIQPRNRVCSIKMGSSSISSSSSSSSSRTNN